jgi:hypothetical protein
MEAHRFIFRESAQDMANNLTLITSKMKNYTDFQSKFLAGEATFEEIFSFFTNNPELFETMEDVEAFLSGENISDQLFVEKAETQRRALSSIVDLERQLAEVQDDPARKSAILAQIGAYRALIQFNGPLSQMTENQFSFNAELERYNRLSAAGVETAED